MLNRNRIYFGLLILILVVVIAWASYGMLNAGKEEKTYLVSVIFNDSNSDRWTTMREGLEQAASDNNMELNIVSTGNMQDASEQKAVIQRELDNGAQGIILEPISSSELSDEIADISVNTALILLDTDVQPEDVYATAKSDNQAIGQAIGQAMVDDLGRDLTEKKIGVLCGNQAQSSMQQRLDGLNSILGKNQIQTEWTLNTMSDNLNEELLKKQVESPVDILVTLGNNETEKAVDYIQTINSSMQVCLIYGEGCSEKSVYYLDKGVIQSLVVPNEFNMGYQSMAAIAKQLQYKLSSAESTQIDFLVINKNNLYDADNQKILFPIVQ